MDHYEFQTKLGEGAYGSVWKCLNTQSGEYVAIKKLKDVPQNEQEMEYVIREVRLLEVCRHPNIVQLVEVFRSQRGRLYLIFEYVETTLLQELRMSQFGIPLVRVKQYIWQLLSAVSFLHKNKIIHRDIKPANILLSDKGKIKLCDFGFARPMRSDHCRDADYTFYVVTRWYRAPEVLVGDAYGPGVDIWAIGCIFAELVTGRPLFPGKNEHEQLWLIMTAVGALTPRQALLLKNDAQFKCFSGPAKHEQESLAFKLPSFTQPMMAFLVACLTADPGQRSTADDLLAMPLFAGVRNFMGEEASGVATTSSDQDDDMATKLNRLRAIKSVTPQTDDAPSTIAAASAAATANGAATAANGSAAAAATAPPASSFSAPPLAVVAATVPTATAPSSVPQESIQQSLGSAPLPARNGHTDARSAGAAVPAAASLPLPPSEPRAAGASRVRTEPPKHITSLLPPPSSSFPPHALPTSPSRVGVLPPTVPPLMRSAGVMSDDGGAAAAGASALTLNMSRRAASLPPVPTAPVPPAAPQPMSQPRPQRAASQNSLRSISALNLQPRLNGELGPNGTIPRRQASFDMCEALASLAEEDSFEPGREVTPPSFSALLPPSQTFKASPPAPQPPAPAGGTGGTSSSTGATSAMQQRAGRAQLAGRSCPLLQPERSCPQLTLAGVDNLSPPPPPMAPLSSSKDERPAGEQAGQAGRSRAISYTGEVRLAGGSQQQQQKPLPSATARPHACRSDSPLPSQTSTISELMPAAPAEWKTNGRTRAFSYSGDGNHIPLPPPTVPGPVGHVGTLPSLNGTAGGLQYGLNGATHNGSLNSATNRLNASLNRTHNLNMTDRSSANIAAASNPTTVPPLSSSRSHQPIPSRSDESLLAGINGSNGVLDPAATAAGYSSLLLAEASWPPASRQAALLGGQNGGGGARPAVGALVPSRHHTSGSISNGSSSNHQGGGGGGTGGDGFSSLLAPDSGGTQELLRLARQECQEAPQQQQQPLRRPTKSVKALLASEFHQPSWPVGPPIRS